MEKIMVNIYEKNKKLIKYNKKRQQFGKKREEKYNTKKR